MTDHRTLVAIKIRTSRASRDAWSLFVIMLCASGFIGVIAAAQVFTCAKDRKEWTIKECLAPGIRKN